MMMFNSFLIIYSTVRQLSDAELVTWLDANKALWEDIMSGKVAVMCLNDKTLLYKHFPGSLLAP